MKYGESLKAHLARYKRSVLDIPEDGTWVRNGRTYPHILPRALQDLNLIEPIRSQCLFYMGFECIKRHANFPHLNSSQAFAFNLFFPWLTDSPESCRSLLHALGVGGRVKCWKFEAVLDWEERTNFDLWLDLGGHGQVFVDVKLTERGFGASRPNKRRRDKLDEIYRDRLTGKVAAETLDGDAFFKYYQLLRSLSYVHPRNKRTLLLVFPRANERVRVEAQTFLRDVVLESCRPCVRIVYVEDVFRRLHENRVRSPRVRDSLQALGEKYALSGPSD